MNEYPTYDVASEKALSCVSSLGVETVELNRAAGRVLREELVADRDQPPFDRSAMDGFALCAAAWEAGKVFRIAGTVPAGGELPTDITIDPARDVVRIATGAAVPEVFDAVIQIEKAIVDEALPGSGETVRFEVGQVKPGAAIHPRSADAAAGAVVVEAGAVLGPHHLGIAATVGASELVVTRRPRVVVLSSGDEVWPVGTPRADLPAQAIRNSNGPMLVALLTAMGAEVVRHEHVVDEAEAVRAACGSAAAEADLVVTAGGVSVGQRDLFPTTWPTLGYETVLHGVAMQPGKPVWFGVRGAGSEAREEGDDRAVRTSDPGPRAPVIGLPGNPVSVWATAHLFVWPLVRKLSGLDPGLPWRRVWLASPTRGNARREAFRAARFVGETREQVEVIAWQGSGDLMHTAAADGLLRLPVHGGELPAGTGLSLLPVLGGGAGGAA